MLIFSRSNFSYLAHLVNGTKKIWIIYNKVARLTKNENDIDMIIQAIQELEIRRIKIRSLFLFN